MLRDNHKCRPDYKKLYPDENISEDIQSFLKKSDMRMEYEDYHRKRERIRKTKSSAEISLPPLECSFEALSETGYIFESNEASPEQTLLKGLENFELHQALKKLSNDEFNIIYAAFWDRQTLRNYAENHNMSKSAANRLKQRSLLKLKNILENF